MTCARATIGTSTLLVLAVVGALSCRSPTQITVEVRTDFHCDALQSTTIAVGTLGPSLEDGGTSLVSTLVCEKSTGRVGSLVVLPSGNGDEVAIRVVVGLGKNADQCVKPDYSGCIVARRDLSFVTHSELDLPITMSLDCRDVRCDDTQTCVHGACVSAKIADSTRCHGNGCDESILGGQVGDAGVDVADTSTDALADVVDSSGVDGNPDAGPGGCTGSECGEGLHLSAGEKHTCVLETGGVVKCWGDDTNGQLGVAGGGPPVPRPRIVTGIPAMQQIGAGKVHTCALTTAGDVHCWGTNGNLQIGSLASLGVPGKVTTVAKATTLAVGSEFNFAIAGSVVYGWGGNGLAELAVDPLVDQEPTPLARLAGVTLLTAGTAGGCGLFPDAHVKCWGVNSSGELGSGSLSDPPLSTPRDVVGLGAVSGLTSQCAITTDARVMCWGSNEFGQLNVPDPSARLRADLVPDVDHVVQLDSDDAHLCALLDSGLVKCWGENDRGQIGLDRAGSPEPPTIVPGLTGIRAISVGASYSCAWKADGLAWCWGQNDQGQLGDGTQLDQHKPTPVKF